MEVGIFFSVLAIVVLMVLSAFFSGSETALTAASKVRLHAKAKEGNRGAIIAEKIRQKKDRLIGALLLTNNLVNILASALATSLMIRLFGDAGVVYATLVMTLMLVVFSEVLPKTYAIHHADTMSMKIAPFIRVLVTFLSPITEAVTWVVRACLRLFGVDISKVTAGSHLELLRGVIDMHHGPEKETRQQRAMLRSILDLFDVEVSDIMIHRQNVAMIDASQSTKEIFREVLESPYTRLPIWKDDPDNITGIIHVKLLMKELNENAGDISGITLDNVTLDPWFIPETTSLYDQLQAFRERQEHFAVVVDEYGAFMGIVTLEDILEEIVGDIHDEHDISVPGVRKLQDGSYLIDGTVTIRDLDREFNWGLPDDDYSTLAGLIIHESQRIPEMGQSFSFYNFHFDVVRRQRNQIMKVRVLPPSASKAIH